MRDFRTLNDFRVHFDIQYEYATAAQQAIIYELHQLREAIASLQSSNIAVSSDVVRSLSSAIQRVADSLPR